jgi:hypothetical protein
MLAPNPEGDLDRVDHGTADRVLSVLMAVCGALGLLLLAYRGLGPEHTFIFNNGGRLSLSMATYYAGAVFLVAGAVIFCVRLLVKRR